MVFNSHSSGGVLGLKQKNTTFQVEETFEYSRDN